MLDEIAAPTMLVSSIRSPSLMALCANTDAGPQRDPSARVVGARSVRAETASHNAPYVPHMASLGTVHLFLGFAALAFGALVALTRKGTRRHRWIGWAYVWSMLSLNGTALLIYRLFGTFGPFHFAALVSLTTVVAGMVPAYRRPSRWIEWHAMWMSWSYVGLCAAAVAEIWTRFVAPNAFWGAVVAATLAVVVIGKFVIDRRMPRILAAFPRR